MANKDKDDAKKKRAGRKPATARAKGPSSRTARAKPATRTGGRAAAKKPAAKKPAAKKPAVKTSRATKPAAKTATRKPAKTTASRAAARKPGRKPAAERAAAKTTRAKTTRAKTTPAKTTAARATGAKTTRAAAARAKPAAKRGAAKPPRTTGGSSRAVSSGRARPSARPTGRPAAPPRATRKPPAVRKPARKPAARKRREPAQPESVAIAPAPAPRAQEQRRAPARSPVAAAGRTPATAAPPARRAPARAPLRPPAAAPAEPAADAPPAETPAAAPAAPPVARRPAAPPAVRRAPAPPASRPAAPAPAPVAEVKAAPAPRVEVEPPVAANGIVVRGRSGPRYDEVLTPAALDFVADLHRRFNARRKELLRARAERQKRFDQGELPDFLPETKHVREMPWKVAPIPPDLLDRRVEITGPVDRKMIINALNSGARVFMADFEDANSPTWSNSVEGQINLKDRWHAPDFDWVDPGTGKHYRMSERPAVLIIRPRGLHLLERHLEIDREPVAGAFFDFGLYAFHNAKATLEKGSGPYFYLPKLESHLEARLWNEVFNHAQSVLGLPRGSIKATVLIETLPAAFEMHEILHELKDHIVGLNCGRWDYIFSFIKKLAKNSAFILPDRGQVVMGKAFLKAYSHLLIRTCHARGAFAMGGMAAQIPIKGDPAANEAAFAKVRADKEREAGDGHDGTWVAHPDLVPVAMEVFDRMMPGRNQLDELREDVDVGQAELLEVHQGTRSEEGFRANIRVGVQYIEAWLRGRGAVPIYNLMEDAATAEICRAQIWQWVKYGAKLDSGVQITPSFFEKALHEEVERVRGEVGEEAFAFGRFPEAVALFRRLSLAPEFEEFLTVPAYALID